MVLLKKSIENQKERDCLWPGINASFTDKVKALIYKYKRIASDFALEIYCKSGRKGLSAVSDHYKYY